MNMRLKLYPTPLPDEHILGTLVRWHNIQSYDNFYQSCKWISNNSYNLNPDCAWRRIYNDLFRILQESMPFNDFLNHTHFNYYSTFSALDFHHNTPSSAEYIERKVIPKFQNYIKNSKQWRWCYLCSLEDEKLYGTSYWHNSHQIPSITQCTKHNVDLVGVCEKCNFRVTDLSSGILPQGNRCLRCGHQQIERRIDNGSLNHWISNISKSLYKLAGSSRLEQIKIQLKLHLNEFLDLNNISIHQHNKPTAISSAFLKSIDHARLIESFFVGHFYRSGPRPSLNIDVLTVIHDSNVYPPLYYLLLLKVIVRDDQKILSILGINGESCP